MGLTRLTLIDISDTSIPAAKTRLVDRIRDQIVTGAFPLGARVSDKEIAAEMNVSRTPVREALLQLQSEGLIIVRPRSGTFVFGVSQNDLSQICEMRSLFETGALNMAAAVNPATLVGALTYPVAEAALALEEKDYARCETLDTVFHETLIALSGNRYLVESYRTISTKVRALRSRLPQNHARIAGAIAQHRRIIDLVAVGKTEAASAELASHVSNVKTQLLFVTSDEAALKAAG
jgi:DNA-binding GntR family transcriptional regulator